MIEFNSLIRLMAGKFLCGFSEGAGIAAGIILIARYMGILP